jgi:hypothetical protein
MIYHKLEEKGRERLGKTPMKLGILPGVDGDRKANPLYSL